MVPSIRSRDPFPLGCWAPTGRSSQQWNEPLPCSGVAGEGSRPEAMEATATRRAFCCNHLKAATKVQIPTSPTSPECRCKNGHSGGGDTWRRQDPVVAGHPPAGNEGTKWPVSPFCLGCKTALAKRGVVSRVLMVLPRISTCSSTSPRHEKLNLFFPFPSIVRTFHLASRFHSFLVNA